MLGFRYESKACEDNYPINFEISPKNIPSLKVIPPSKESLMLCATYLKKYGTYYYPCKQLGCQLERLYISEESMAEIYK